MLWSYFKTSPITYIKIAPFLQYHAANCLFCLVYTSILVIIKKLFLKKRHIYSLENRNIIMLIYNIYKWLYYTVGLVIVEGGGVISTIMSRYLRITFTTPRSSQLSPRKHEALKQWWYNVGPTLKTVVLCDRKDTYWCIITLPQISTDCMFWWGEFEPSSLNTVVVLVHLMALFLKNH